MLNQFPIILFNLCLFNQGLLNPLENCEPSYEWFQQGTFLSTPKGQEKQNNSSLTEVFTTEYLSTLGMGQRC